MTRSLLEITGLDVAYPRARGQRRAAPVLHGIDLTIRPGETVGLVGESGSGKTTLGRAIVGLASATSGSIVFDGQDITAADRAARRALARDVQVVFQDPYSSLNPMLSVADTLAEPLRAAGVARETAHARVSGLLARVRLPEDAAERYPSEFSGGQRQRIAIARALALDPRLIVCDEPVSALDLSTRAHVLDLLVDIQRDSGVAYLMITHDLAVVRRVCHRVAVMRAGRIVEFGDTGDIVEHPTHPYTQRLLLASPVADPAQQRARRTQLRSLGRGESVAHG